MTAHGGFRSGAARRRGRALRADRRAPAARRAADAALLAQLTRLTDEGKAYREEGLSIAALAARLADLPCRYGLVKPLASNNPIVIAFHEWAALARDLWRARSWRERWQYVFGPPGWRPDGAGSTTEDLRRAALAAE